MNAYKLILCSCIALGSMAGCAPKGTYLANRTMAETVPEGATSAWDSPPKLVAGKTPIFPIEELLARRGGSATVAFTVGIDGRTSHVEVASATKPVFGDHAAIAVREWIFKPALKDGRPVAVRLRQQIAFPIP